ncbi:MAG TPA: FAD-linked oxidase C-terminal domain-containing protein [Solirubrobacteraceae bacterium]
MGTLDELRAVVGDAGFVEGDALEPYTHDATFMRGAVAAALRPAGVEEVARVLAICNDAGMPVVARGGGTSLVGGPVALAGGVVLSLERMRTIEVDAPNACAVVEAGAINGDLRRAAAAEGLWYPPDPSSMEISTIGGNVACNAGGICCLKYGVTADYVIGMTVVLADGAVIELGGRTRKRSSGYRLAQLFVGSEGTLGVITSVCVKLIPLPRARRVALVAFADIVAAGEAVARLLGAGHLPCALELLDRGALELVADRLPAGFATGAGAALLVEQDGGDGDVVEQELAAMVALLGGIDERIAVDAQQRERLWQARRDVGVVALEAPGVSAFSEDVVVPIAQIPAMLARIEAIRARTRLRIPVVGHAGDGNLHPIILFGEHERDRVGAVAEEIFEAAVALGGSISAEHGLGALKRDHAVLEHSDRALALMRALKAQLDPNAILNPHKVLPEGPADAGFLERLPR